MKDFKSTEKYTPRTDRERNLVEVFAKLESKQQAAAFLRDLLTPAEIEEFANRLEIARLLLKDYSYLDIAHKVGVSTTTVTRVAHWLYRGCGGYWKALKKG